MEILNKTMVTEDRRFCIRLITTSSKELLIILEECIAELPAENTEPNYSCASQ
jgi:hypothetical protein